MLQMKCPSCAKVISSPLLAEMSSIECGHCKETVEVGDVFVTTKGFTMHRGDLLKRIFRYRSLLAEVEKERVLMVKDESVSAATKKSIEQFYVTLQELLVGARSSYRFSVPFDLPIDVEYQGKTGQGRLVNLSSKGASINLQTTDKAPRQGSEIHFEIPLDIAPKALSIQAKVLWLRKIDKNEANENLAVGVAFVNLGEDIRNSIWDFCIDKLYHAQND
jgi:hypothetical protein